MSPRPHATRRAPALPLFLLPWFAATLFFSAFLLFSVQPMFAKLVLPVLGGAPAVWNTCLVFFQAMLLLGYGYAHVTTRWLGVRRQAALHLAVVMLPLLLLPLGVPTQWSPPVEANPIPWLLGVLTLTVGVPFFVVATSAPLLQAWFAHTGHPDARDPYFLYAASNGGSLIALVSYPVLIEPHVRLLQQRWAWAAGYGLLVLGIAGCAALLWRTLQHETVSPSGHRSTDAPTAAPTAPTTPTAHERLAWVLYSAVPSSLLLGVTTYLSTDIAAIPLLWIVPLALYLLTFILVFARRPWVSQDVMIRLLPLLLLPLVVLMTIGSRGPAWLLIALHLSTFFAAAMVCHGELARRRPAPDHLTSFYLWLAVGGVLGGGFNALAAPLLFDTVVEYPLMLMAVCLLRSAPDDAPPTTTARWMDYAWPAALGVLAVSLQLSASTRSSSLTTLELLAVYGVPVLCCFAFRYRPVRFGLSVGAVLAVGLLMQAGGGHLRHVERSFFRVYRVLDVTRHGHRLRKLEHGSTLHGLQDLDPVRRREPLTYYGTAGPIGQVLASRTGPRAWAHVAVVGLGTGTMAAYARPGQAWTFYEIDPLVQRLTSGARYFSYLTDAQAPVAVVLGDARRSLARAPRGRYDLLVLDAFSSDAIRVHLLTREAIECYVATLADGGVLAVHVSNRYLVLRPVVGDIAGALGLACLAQSHRVAPERMARGLSPSEWVLLARRVEDFGPLATDRRWRRVAPRPGAAVWTDDFSNLISVFQWR